MNNIMTPSPRFEAEALVSGHIRINGKVYRPSDKPERIYPHRKQYIRDLFARAWEYRANELKEIGRPLYYPE